MAYGRVLADDTCVYQAQDMKVSLIPPAAWGVQQGRSVIPKSVNPGRFAENFDVFDFELTPTQLSAIDALDTNERGGPNPDDITLETFGRVIPEA